jgi:hypothetical protein
LHGEIYLFVCNAVWHESALVAHTSRLKFIRSTGIFTIDQTHEWSIGYSYRQYRITMDQATDTYCAKRHPTLD